MQTIEQWTEARDKRVEKLEAIADEKKALEKLLEQIDEAYREALVKGLDASKIEEEKQQIELKIQRVAARYNTFEKVAEEQNLEEAKDVIAYFLTVTYQNYKKKARAIHDERKPHKRELERLQRAQTALEVEFADQLIKYSSFADRFGLSAGIMSLNLQINDK